MKWVDLSRFGAQLRVYERDMPLPVPESASCLLVNDPDLFAETANEKSGMASLGFTEVEQGYYTSPSLKFHFSELKKLFPSLSAADYKEFTDEQILIGEKALSEALSLKKDVSGAKDKEKAHEKPSDSPDVHKHEDFGEKIGGARKDFYKHALTVDDLALMSDHEKNTLVIKNNIWPPINYREAVNNGEDPFYLLFQKMIRDSIAPKLETSDTSSLEAYVNSISLIKGWLEKHQVDSDVMSVMKKLCDFALIVVEEQNGYKRILTKKNTVLLGSKFVKKLQLYSEYRNRIKSEEHKIYPDFFRKKLESLIQDSKLEEFYSRYSEEYSRNLMFYREFLSNEEVWKAISPALFNENTQSKDLQGYDDSQNKKEKAKLIARPHLKHLERISEFGERNGKNIIAHDLCERFGFRAVEFGNWLNQDERQTVLNWAYDSFDDLCAVLDIPPKAISFGGNLAIAFGSRGKGGRASAVAHYEPARRVINLTRLSGAGALAHEWCHALDNYFGDWACNASHKENKPHSINNFVQRLDKAGGLPYAQYLREEVEKGQGSVYLFLKASGKAYDYVDTLRKQLFEYLDRLVKEARTIIDQELPSKTAEEKALYVLAGKAPSRGIFNFPSYKNFLAKTVTDYIVFIENKNGGTPFSKCYSDSVKFEQILRSNTAKAISFSEQYLRIKIANDMGIYAVDRLSEKMAEIGWRNMCIGRYSQFKIDAISIDANTRSTPYYAKTLEMFARAGEAFIFDKLHEAGTKNDYLVHSVEGSVQPDSFGCLYPTGTERTEFNSIFEQIIADFKKKFELQYDPDMQSEAFRSVPDMNY